jgi:uncharacterized protein (TIGR03000 family)
VTIDVPADARVYIDDQLMRTTSARRVFRSPELQPGQAYFYIIRVEVDRNGRTLTDSQRVVIRAGDSVQASFARLGNDQPSDRAVATADR